MVEIHGVTTFFNTKNNIPAEIVISVIDIREESNTIKLGNKNPADFNRDFSYRVFRKGKSEYFSTV